jgi:flavin reductase (DIM6/NTAB) family NADH-FMN oxidoreductase RutF
MSVDPQASMAAALGRLPSGLFILTIGHGSEGTGMLVSWVQQCSFDPPMLTVALRRQRFPDELSQRDTPFVLNQLAEGQTRLLSHFGRGFGPGEPSFTGIDVAHSTAGPAVLDVAHAYLECRAEARVPVGDHDLLVARVVDGLVRSDEPPYVHIRKSGLRY